ncbi:MAG: hypothetical protein ACE5H9_07790 [Anaerolineae bacterium]
MPARTLTLLLAMAFLTGVATPFAFLALKAGNSIGGRFSFLVLLLIAPLLFALTCMVLAR